MKFKLNKILLTSCFFGAALVIAPTATLLSSCSSEIQTNQIVKINKQYSSNESEQLTKTYSFPQYSSASTPEVKSGDVTTQASVQKLYDNAKKAKAELETFKTSNSSSLGIDEQIWLDSYITQWDIKIKNIETGLIYLGADPISGSRMLSSRANSIANNIKDAINIYDLNEETGDPDTTKPNESLIKNINSKIDDAIAFIRSIKGFLTDGMELQIMPSQLTKKSFIKQTVQFFYQDLVNAKLPNETGSINVTDLFTTSNNTSSSNKYFTQTFKAIYDEQAKKMGVTNDKIDDKLNELSKSLDEFMNFYCGKYWKATGSYGGVPTSSNNGANQNPVSIPDLTLSRQNLGTTNSAPNSKPQAAEADTKEVEQTLTLTLKDGVLKVYGLGYSTQDLKTKGIGLGYMTPKAGATSLSGKAYSGNEIYQQMLYNNNSVNTSAQEIYNTGMSLTSSGTTKMKKIASNVITDIYKETNESSFNPTIWYTADPFKIKPQQKTIKDILTPSEAPKAGDADSPSNSPDSFTKFNVWLNQEDFFFGREKITNISDYWIQSTPQIEKYKNIIQTQGYEEKWSKKTNIDGSDVTVSGDQALAGAVLSLLSYTQFKDSTSKSYSANFNSIADYVLSPYNFDIREDIGVGMEGPRGSKQFQYNCDPYYGLQKWSVASLTTHEGAMGHHTQQEYWTEYMPGTSDGKVLNDDATPGYSFVNDAYHEGWAVFTEWFAAELGTYGTWGSGSKYDGNKVPTDWTHNTSTILNIKDPTNPTSEEIAFIKNYQGGTYWQLVSNITKSSDGKPAYTSYADIAVAATKLANMLSYYGFLNESQLRNMRMALDTAVHFKGLTVTDGNLGQGGASIQDERDFMKKNSGLGAGDISSESIRYLSIPSQATGYMLGKQIINDLYTKLKTKVQNINKSNPNYDFVIDGKNDIKSLFDLILRNGEIPLQVLIDVVTKQFGLTPTTTPPANANK